MSAIVGALSRSAHFIAWGNFVDPNVLWMWVRTLMLLALVSVVAWSAGRHVCRALKFRSPEEELVLTVTSGLAALALVTTGLAFVGLYTWWAGSLFAIAITASAVRHLPRFARVVGQTARNAPMAAVLALLLSLRTLMPPYRWDEVSYHLAYPQQWIQVGHLTIDPHFAYPLYTLTWQSLLGFMLMLGAAPLAHCLTWLTGVLTAWCIGLYLGRLGAADTTVRVARVAFLVTPLVLSLLDVALVDVPIMCFLTVGIFALFALRDELEARPAAVLPAALCAATLVGLKVTNVLFVPLFLGIAAYRVPRRTLVVYATVLAGAALPWFLRNMVVTGDPLTPLIAHALGRAAPYWSPGDLAAQAADLRRGLSYAPSAILALPVRVLFSTDDGLMRGPPLVGYALLLPASLVLARRLARDRAADVLLATWYTVAVWVVTTYLIRYAYWIPLSVVCSALLVDRAVRAIPERRRSWGWVVAGLLLIGPTPSAAVYLKNAFHDRVPTDPRARRAYAFSGCADDCAFGAVVRAAQAGAQVYTVAPPMTYYWQQASLHVLSGALHPGGLLQFDAALEGGHAVDFLHSLGVDYLVLDDRYAAHMFNAPRDTVAARVRRALGPPLWADSVEAAYSVVQR